MRSSQNDLWLDLMEQLLQDKYQKREIRQMLDSFVNRTDNRLRDALTAAVTANCAEVAARLAEKDRQLAAINATLAETQKIARLGNWTVDLQTNDILWSKMMYTILEVNPSVTPRQETLFNKIDPRDRSAVMRKLEKIDDVTAPEGMLFRLVMGDGRIKWVLSRYSTPAKPNEKPVLLYGTLQDVTTTREAELKLQEYNEHLEDRVAEKVKELVSSQTTTVYAIVKMAETRDGETGRHIERAVKYCRLLAQKAKDHSLYADQIDDDFVNNIALAGPLHDIGKVGIPDAILLKTGRLTREEFEVIKTHVTIGYATLAAASKMNPANAALKIGMDIALYHHERWDGQGYQAGLEGTNIPLSARIMAIVDMYDALRSKRVYKGAYSHQKSMQIIQGERGAHFDPILTDLFAQYNREFEAIFDHSKSTSE